MSIRERVIHARDLVVGGRYKYRYERGGVHSGHCIIEHVQKQPLWRNKPLAVTFKPDFAKRIKLRAELVEFSPQEVRRERST